MRAESLAFRTSFFSFSVSPRIQLFGRLLRTSETGRRGSGSLMCRSDLRADRGLRGDLSPLALRSAVPGAGYRDPRRDSAVPGEIRIISQIVSCRVLEVGSWRGVQGNPGALPRDLGQNNIMH